MGEISTCSLAYRLNPQGPSRELIDSIQGLMVGRRESQQGPQPFTHLTGLEHFAHNADLLKIITEAMTFTFSSLDSCITVFVVVTYEEARKSFSLLIDSSAPI